MLVGKTPPEVNQILKDNGGFTQGSGNFIWSKSIVLGLAQHYSSPRYEGPVTDAAIQKAKDFLTQGYPVVCEVDFNPATYGEEQHYVLLTGFEGDKFFINDPWMGQELTLDTYGGFKRAVLQFRVYDKKFTEGELPVDVYTELDKCTTDRNSHWDSLLAIKNKLKLDGEFNLTVLLADLDKLMSMEQSVIEKDRKLTELTQTATELQGQIVTLKEENKALQGQVEAQKKDVELLQTSNTNQLSKILSLAEEIQDLKIQIKEPSLSGWKLILKGIGKVIFRK